MRIGTIERTDASIVSGFKKLLDAHDSVTCAVSDCMGRYNAMTGDMRPLFENIRMVGTAVTVKTLASDLGAVFKAIDLCQPGDIIVIDSRGSLHTAFWGENVSLSAINKGVVGVVVDGATRDVEEIRKLKFPVISKGIVPNVGSVSGYGQVNVPIQCAGVAVNPGDVIIVDGNGVVVVARQEAADILNKANELMGKEHTVTEKLKAGQTIGQLVDIDRIAASVFDYQYVAAKDKN